MTQFWYTILCLSGGVVIGLAASFLFIYGVSIVQVKERLENDQELAESLKKLFDSETKYRKKKKDESHEDTRTGRKGD